MLATSTSLLARPPARARLELARLMVLMERVSAVGSVGQRVGRPPSSTIRQSSWQRCRPQVLVYFGFHEAGAARALGSEPNQEQVRPASPRPCTQRPLRRRSPVASLIHCATGLARARTSSRRCLDGPTRSEGYVRGGSRLHACKTQCGAMLPPRSPDCVGHP